MLLLGILFRSTRAEETEGTILKAMVLVSIAIVCRLSLVRSPVIIEEGLRLNLLRLRLLVIIL
jgi:hypothetical protein